MTMGYTPSKGPMTIEINQILSFDTETRDRAEGREELIVFDAPFAEGGNSGAPVCGEGGGVVGAVIECFQFEDKQRARATSLRPLLRQLHFHEETR
jgi:hypothetical protein